MTTNNLTLTKLSNTASKSKSLSVLTALFLLPTLAFAHPGHGLFISDGSLFSSIISGMIHPLTGLDHLMLALGMGILFTQMDSFKSGLSALSIGLVAGFALSSVFNLNSVFVETGIMVSIVVLTMALMNRCFNNSLNDFGSETLKKVRMTSTVSFATLAMFHGAAHALEVPTNSITTGFFIGMIVAMLGLYVVGKGIATYLNTHMENNFIIQRVMAVVGLCAVLFS